MCRGIPRAVLCSLRGTLVVLSAECVILQLNKHSAFGEEPRRRLHVCFVQCVELFQVRSYEKQKVSLPLEAANHTQPGEAATVSG